MERQNYYEQNEERKGGAPKKIGDLMRLPLPPAKKTTGGINSLFNAAVARAIEEVMGKGKPFGYWCGRLRGVPAQRIHEWVSKCKEAKNPPALFEHLLKQYRAEVKK